VSPFYQYIASFGILGIVFIALWTGFLYTKQYVDELKENHEKEIAKLEKENDEEVTELKQALALERQRSDVGIVAGSILKDIVSELRRELPK
jgi:hypothetical protein